MVLRCYKDCMTKYGTFKVGLFEISNEAGFHLLKNRNFEQIEGVFALDLQSQVSKMTLIDCLNYPQNLNKFCPSQEYLPVCIKPKNYTEYKSDFNYRLGIVVCHYETEKVKYYLLRFLIDSIRKYLRKGEDYAELVIVNDCSDLCDESFDYLRWLNESKIAVVLKLGDAKPPHFKSYGHGVSLVHGVDYLKSVGCTHALILDSDTVILKPLVIKNAMQLFRYEDVISVSDYYGGSVSAYDQICDVEYEISYEKGVEVKREDKASKPYRISHLYYGYPHLSCALVDIKECVDLVRCMERGEINKEWYKLVVWDRKRMGFYPFYQGEYVFHLGYASLTPTKTESVPEFGNSIYKVFWPKEAGIFYYGYLQLNMISSTFVKSLRTLFADVRRPDDIIEFDKSWVSPPPQSWAAKQPEVFVRQMRDKDVESVANLILRAGGVYGWPYAKNKTDLVPELTSLISKEILEYYVFIFNKEVIGIGRMKLEIVGDKVYKDKFYTTSVYFWVDYEYNIEGENWINVMDIIVPQMCNYARVINSRGTMNICIKKDEFLLAYALQNYSKSIGILGYDGERVWCKI